MEAKHKSWEEFAVNRSANETSYMRGIADYKASLREAIEKEMEGLTEKKHPRTLEAYRNVLELLDTVNPMETKEQFNNIRNYLANQLLEESKRQENVTVKNTTEACSLLVKSVTHSEYIGFQKLN